MSTNKKKKSPKSKGVFISYKTLALIIITFILSILIIVTVAQNRGDTSIRFLFFDYTVPIVMVVAFAGIIGLVIGALLVRKYYHQKK